MRTRCARGRSRRQFLRDHESGKAARIAFRWKATRAAGTAYISFGEYYSAGTNFSEAGGSLTTIESVDIGGVVTTLTKTTAARVFAGGFSTARAF